MQGKKTHEQQLRTLERKADLAPAARSDSDKQQQAIDSSGKVARREGRQSEFPVSSSGMNQESDHNKHNHSSQQGHKPQTPQPAQQKQD